MEFDSGDPYSSPYEDFSAYAATRTRNVELRGGKLYKSCECMKRNGLQLDCRKMECRSYNESHSSSHSPDSSTRRMANYLGRGIQDSFSSYMENPRLSRKSGMHFPDIARGYEMSGIGDGNYLNYGGLSAPYHNQFMSPPPPPQQVAPYGAGGAGEVPPSFLFGQYANYGTQNMGAAMPLDPYGGYVQA